LAKLGAARKIRDTLIVVFQYAGSTAVVGTEELHYIHLPQSDVGGLTQAEEDEIRRFAGLGHVRVC
jgi:hypothetical protein